MKRKIAAILAADVAGYSRLVAEDEEDALRRLAACRAVFDDGVRSAGGRIFNTAGDAVLAEFKSAVDAVRCAIDVQESIRTRNLAYPQSRQMNFRIGITIGDVVEQNGDLLGDGVNLAARLEGLASPGGIAVSRSVHEAVVNKMSIGFNDLGLKTLKNIPDRMQVYTIDTAPPSTGAPTGVLGAITRYPVSMPLLALCIGLAAGGAVYYAFGTPEEATAKKPSPALVPHEAVATIESKTAPPPEPPPAAGGAPSESGAQPAAQGTALPSHPPAASSPEPAAAPNGGAGASGAKEGETAAPPAATEEGQAPGPDYFIAKHVLPHAKQDCLEGDPMKVGDACRLVIQNGLATGAALATAHVRLGRSQREAGAPEDAVASYSKAIEIEPTAEAFTQRGVAHFDREQWDAAAADYGKAIALDARAGEAYNNRAWLYYRLGEYDKAAKDANQAVKLIPDAAYAWDTRAHINEAMGNKAAAISDFREALRRDPAGSSSREGLVRLGEKP